VVAAISSGNVVTPSGNITLGEKAPMVPMNSVVMDIKDLEKIPIRVGVNPTVFVRDIATVEETQDIPTSYALVNGRRSVYMVVTKRADASTLAVVNEVKANLGKMREAVPKEISIDFVFDQSPYVTRAMTNVVLEGLLGAFLTGLMVLLFLRDWRSVIV